MQRLAVYCGSASPDPRWVDLARDVGEHLAKAGIGVVYGGGRLGLMGALASGALGAGGEVIGIIPHALANAEMANLDCSELIRVDTMHERKALFNDRSDGFITLPGGTGTMDELWEAVSWAQLGYHAKPVGVLNAWGYYDQLIAFNRHMIETGFVRAAHAGIIIAEPDLTTLLASMAAFKPVVPVVKMDVNTL